MILKLTGIVDTPDGTSHGKYTIGGVDVIDAIERADWAGPVTVAIADETFDGDLDAWHGVAGYSEYTPGDPAFLTVGPHDLLAVLERYDSEMVTLWVADEPVNTLA